MDKNTPAFPTTTEHGFNSGVGGMNLRDYFAAKAMQSVLDGSWPELQLNPISGLTPVENSAIFAYKIADAMMAAREA